MNTMETTQNNRFNFAILMIADFVSSLGSSMTGVALTLEIYEKTGNLMTSALFSLILLLPQLVITPFVTKMRFNLSFKSLFCIGELVCVIQIAALLFIDKVIYIYILFFIYSGAFFVLECLRAEYLKMITIDEEQQKRQGISRMVNIVVTVVGPIIGGIILTNYGVEIVYIIDIITYIAAALIILLLKDKRKPGVLERDKATIKEGLRGMGNNADIYIGSIIVTFIGGATSILTLEYIYGVLKESAVHYSFLMAAMSGGAFIGSFLGSLSLFRNKLKKISIGGTLLMGILLLSVLLRPNFEILLAILAVSGILSSLIMLYYSIELFIRSNNEKMRGEYAFFKNAVDFSQACSKPFGALVNSIMGCVYSIAAMGGVFMISAVGFISNKGKSDS